MSVIDSRRYGRRSPSSFTIREFEQILNAPKPDHAKIKAESDRILAGIIKAERASNNALVQE